MDNFSRNDHSHKDIMADQHQLSNDIDLLFHNHILENNDMIMPFFIISMMKFFKTKNTEIASKFIL